MILHEHVALAPFTTFHLGGEARFFIEGTTVREVEEAIVFARTQQMPLLVLGGGSNVLVTDHEIAGVVLRVALTHGTCEDFGTTLQYVGGAGVSWDGLVSLVGERGFFGVENLAGIPGTLGGAVVQNIGAYGAELESVFVYADTIHRTSGEHRRITHAEAQLGYRTSLFKQEPDYIVTEVALRFSKDTKPQISYPDLLQKQRAGDSLSSPTDIARAVRAIRAKKFPPFSGTEGTAGSFFKNPIISREQVAGLITRFPLLPTFPQKSGDVKVSLAWILDHVLSLKGYAHGRVRLYEHQPLVVVAQSGASAHEVDTFADNIAAKVFEVTHITLEREVESFGGKNIL